MSNTNTNTSTDINNCCYRWHVRCPISKIQYLISYINGHHTNDMDDVQWQKPISNIKMAFIVATIDMADVQYSISDTWYSIYNIQYSISRWHHTNDMDDVQRPDEEGARLSWSLWTHPQLSHLLVHHHHHHQRRHHHHHQHHCRHHHRCHHQRHKIVMKKNFISNPKSTWKSSPSWVVPRRRTFTEIYIGITKNKKIFNSRKGCKKSP